MLYSADGFYTTAPVLAKEDLHLRKAEQRQHELRIIVLWDVRDR